jgi:RadC-like JAB domain
MDMPKGAINHSEAAAKAAAQVIGDHAYEAFLTLFLDSGLKVLGYTIATDHSPSAVGVDPQSIVRNALLTTARAIVTVHQHPSGEASPSSDDRAVWAKIREMTKAMDVQVVDNLIVTPSGSYWSEVENGSGRFVENPAYYTIMPRKIDMVGNPALGKQTLVEITGPEKFISWAERNLDVASSSSSHVAIYLPTGNIMNSLDELQDVLDEAGWFTKDEKMDRDRYKILVARGNPSATSPTRSRRRPTGGQHTRYIGDAAVRLEHYGKGEYEAEISFVRDDRVLWEAPIKVTAPRNPDDPEVIDRLAAAAVHLAAAKSRDVRSATERAVDAHGGYEVMRGNPEGLPPGVPMSPPKPPPTKNPSRKLTSFEGLEKPTGLSPLGLEAYKTIVKFLVKHGLTETGGGRTFYSPAEWRKRGEEYGLDSVLIVTYDGGDVAAAFNYDMGAYDLIESMEKALNKIGLYAEEATGWYSTVHRIEPSSGVRRKKNPAGLTVPATRRKIASVKGAVSTVTVYRLPDTNEYLAKIDGSPPDHGYFTDDKGDAMATAKHMADHPGSRSSR